MYGGRLSPPIIPALRGSDDHQHDTPRRVRRAGHRGRSRSLALVTDACMHIGARLTYMPCVHTVTSLAFCFRAPSLPLLDGAPPPITTVLA